MKIFTIIFTIVAIALIGYNSTKLDFDNLLKGESMAAVMTILAALCGIVLLQILRISKKIDRLSKKQL